MPSRTVPIACSLSADEARVRVARWHDLVLDAKTSGRAQAGLLRAEFRSETAVWNELELLVAAERECCAFLQFDLSRTESAIVVIVTALNEAAAEDLAMLGPALGVVS